MRIDDDLAGFLTFPYRVAAGEFGITGSVVGGRKLKSSVPVWLRAGSLPMGFSWSLYFCQSVG